MVKIASVLDTETDIARARRDRAMPARSSGAIDLDHVTFAYGAEPRAARRRRARAGGRLHSRWWASRAAASRRWPSSIARFYDPRRGQRSASTGIDLRELDLQSLPPPARRGAAGPVPVRRHDRRQHPLRPPGGHRRGGARGRRGASASTGVARASPSGLEHPVREGGAGLSAGERQLISIARALLADPRILILDEATSNIDRPTEMLIERALDRLLHGRTSLIIAHRLSTVRRADEILVVEHGRDRAARTEARSARRRRAVPPARPRARLRRGADRLNAIGSAGRASQPRRRLCRGPTTCRTSACTSRGTWGTSRYSRSTRATRWSCGRATSATTRSGPTPT